MHYHTYDLMHTFEVGNLEFQNEQVCGSHPEAVTQMRFIGVHQSKGVRDRGLGKCTCRGSAKLAANTSKMERSGPFAA